MHLWQRIFFTKPRTSKTSFANIAWQSSCHTINHDLPRLLLRSVWELQSPWQAEVLLEPLPLLETEIVNMTKSILHRRTGLHPYTLPEGCINCVKKVLHGTLLEGFNSPSCNGGSAALICVEMGDPLFRLRVVPLFSQLAVREPEKKQEQNIAKHGRANNGQECRTHKSYHVSMTSYGWPGYQATVLGGDRLFEKLEISVVYIE